jgi:hypothetical protein
MDTQPPNISEHPWMEHDKTGHRSQLPDLPYWRANGWSPCDGPPPEPDILHDRLLRDPEPEPEKAEQPDKPEKPAAKAHKSASTKDGEK